MSGTTLAPDQSITKLRHIEEVPGQAKSMGITCKEVGISEQMYHRWRKDYVGLRLDQAKEVDRKGKRETKAEATGS